MCLNNIAMKEKERYFSPLIEVMQLTTESMLCVSDPDGFGTGDLPGFEFEEIAGLSL